jgi:hypothetical protein
MSSYEVLRLDAVVGARRVQRLATARLPSAFSPGHGASEPLEAKARNLEQIMEPFLLMTHAQEALRSTALT